jgi:hypothetical protein
MQLGILLHIVSATQGSRDGFASNHDVVNLIGLSEDEVRRVGQDPKSSVKLSPENMEGPKVYARMLEVFHRLHCLVSYNYHVQKHQILNTVELNSDDDLFRLLQGQRGDS